MTDELASEAEQLVELLAQIDVESCFEDPARLRAVMAERQAILTALQNTDTQGLSDERRSRLKERLEELCTRNDELIARAAERMEELRKSMQSLAPGKAAVRGYGEQRSVPPPAIKRVG